MTLHGYPWRNLLPDYLRAIGGALATGAALLFVAPASVMLWLLAACCALFLAFGVQTLVRQITVYELSASGLRVVRPLGAAIGWEELRSVGLSYFSTRKDRSRGWMQLTLRGGGTVRSGGAGLGERVLRGRGRAIRIDSRATGFPELARAAADAAVAHRLPLTPSTRANLLALGIDTRPAETVTGDPGQPETVPAHHSSTPAGRS